VTKTALPVGLEQLAYVAIFFNVVGVQNSEKGFGSLLLQLEIRSLETTQEGFTMFCRS
jgi:hypothetical protein